MNSKEMIENVVKTEVKSFALQGSRITSSSLLDNDLNITIDMVADILMNLEIRLHISLPQKIDCPMPSVGELIEFVIIHSRSNHRWE